MEQVLLNDKLKKDVMELEKMAKLSREVPQMLCESVTTCKDIYNDVLSVMQVTNSLFLASIISKCYLRYNDHLYLLHLCRVLSIMKNLLRRTCYPA